MHRCLIGLTLCLFILQTGFTKETEEEIELDDDPALVRTAIIKEADGAAIQSVAREAKDGEVAFEAEWIVDGLLKELVVSPTGATMELEKIVSFASAPAKVKELIRERLANIEQLTVTQKIIIQFEAEGVIDGQKVELLLSPNGKILSRGKADDDDDVLDADDKDEGEDDDADDADDGEDDGEDDDGEDDDEDGDDDDGDDGEEDEDADDDEAETELTLADCPELVAKTFRHEANGGQIQDIERCREDGTIVYEAEIELDGHEYEITVRHDGVLLEKELEEDD